MKFPFRRDRQGPPRPASDVVSPLSDAGGTVDNSSSPRLTYDAEVFVRSLYRDLLGREPDAEGWRGCLHQLREGGDPAQLMRLCLDSAEYRQRRTIEDLSTKPSDDDTQMVSLQTFFRQLCNESPFPKAKDGGIFLTHVLNDRIVSHYNRLKSECFQFNWNIVFNAYSNDKPYFVLPYDDMASKLSSRVVQMTRTSIGHGFSDLQFIPCALATGCEFVWAMEYDVDYAGDWQTFFDQFANDDADLLTTTVVRRDASPEWGHWSMASMPVDVDPAHMYRAFLPIMRISRRLALAYIDTLVNENWVGHCEYTIPTIAMHLGFTVRDISHRRQNYTNTASDPTLKPGTFVWRPSRPRYFHERPDEFEQLGMLYHPIKAEIRGWET